MMSHFAVYEVVSYLFYRFYIVSSAKAPDTKVLKLDVHITIHVTSQFIVAYFTSSPFEGTATAQHGIS